MTDHNETNETNETTQAADLSRTETKAGFVALIGAPNAGKSTLMNAMVGHKVSIVTPKVQTTRSRIRGIGMHQNVQMIFVDTPGIFTPKRRLDRAMVQAAWQGAEDGDVLLLLHDCARRLIDEDTSNILTKLAASGRRASLVLNKIDLAPQERLLERADEMSKIYEFERIFMVSAETGNGVADLKSWLAGKMPKSPFLFDPDDLSDMPLRLLAAETLREKLFLNLHQELPYQLTVETENCRIATMAVLKCICPSMLRVRGIVALSLVKVGKPCAALAPPRAKSWKKRLIAACICSRM